MCPAAHFLLGSAVIMCGCVWADRFGALLGPLGLV